MTPPNTPEKPEGSVDNFKKMSHFDGSINERRPKSSEAQPGAGRGNLEAAQTVIERCLGAIRQDLGQDGSIEIKDLHDQNALVTPSGKVSVIDPLIRILNEPKAIIWLNERGMTL